MELEKITAGWNLTCPHCGKTNVLKTEEVKEETPCAYCGMIIQVNTLPVLASQTPMVQDLVRKVSADVDNIRFV